MEIYKRIKTKAGVKSEFHEFGQTEEHLPQWNSNKQVQCWITWNIEDFAFILNNGVLIQLQSVRIGLGGLELVYEVCRKK